MKTSNENQNTFFNFRIRQTELEKLRHTSRQLGFLSFAEFIRQAIREKISKEFNNAK